MNFCDLVTNLLDEETAMSDIAYLPVHLGKVKKAIATLARLKLDWDIDVLENDGNCKEVRFGTHLKVVVPNEHWDNFLTIFDNCDITNRRLNLQFLLNEALSDETENLVKELKPTLLRAFTNSPFDDLEQDVDRWKARFGVKQYKEQEVPVAYSTKKRDLINLYQNLLETYRDDVGNLEMLIGAFRDKSPLSTFDIFKDYDYIYGARVRSVYLGVTMLFEATIDMTFVISESVYIENQGVVDDVEADDNSIKAVGNVVYPRGERFASNFYRGLYDAIEDMTNE